MLTEQEKKRLAELLEKKKTARLEDKEFAELKKLQSANKKANPKGKGKPKSTFDPGNDPSWWMKQPELVRDSASFKCNYVAGRAIDPVAVPYTVPGVLGITLLTCYHPGSEATDAINVWARNLYLKMFQKYRPANNYSASDLGIALLAGLEAVKLIAVYERIYGIINRYSVLNVNMPTVEAEALGLNLTQLNYLQSHLSDFRYDLNYLIRKAQRLCLPKDISLIADSISLLGYEYIDHDNPRGQIILFTLGNYGVYSDTAISTGGSINFSQSLPSDLFDFSLGNMCKALMLVLDNLLGSDSIQRIYADLVVWFGQDAMLGFMPMPEDYIITPVQSKSILHKLHNLECAPAPLQSSNYPSTAMLLTSWAHGGLSTTDENMVLNGNYNIYQYNDCIVTVGAIKDTNAGTPISMAFNGVTGKILEGTTSVFGFTNSHVIDGYDVDITPEFIIEGSLFKYVSKESDNGTGRLVTSCVNWLIATMTLFTNQQTPGLAPNWRQGAAAEIAAYLALIDWAPLCYELGSGEVIYSILGDIDMVIPVSPGDLTRIQRTCFISGLTTDVPVVNK